MMTDSHAPARPTQLLASRQGATLRTLFEAGLGCALLLLLARMLDSYGGHVGGIVANLLELLGLFWLVAWPAWRLRPVDRDSWWTRTGLGLLRALAVGAILMVVAFFLGAVIQQGIRTWNGVPGVLFWFLVLRTMVLASAAVTRRVRRRFRWQLIVSHAGVIVLMFVSLTSVGSVLGLIVVTLGITSHPADMAASVRDDLELARAVSPADRQRADEVFRLVYARRLPLRGEPPVIALATSPLLPNAMGLVGANGRVLAGRVMLGGDGKKTRQVSSWTELVNLTPARWERLRQTALDGRAGQGSVQRSGSQEIVAEAPIRGPNGTVTSLVVLRVADYRPSPEQFLRLVVTIFGVTTIALILITAIPMIGLSFLFSYLVARGLTRRLESLSRVATSIASGNLGERAPITTSNELGQLAEDVNRMADHLQTTMGELEGARAQAEEALRLRQELVANISHELRTPLATMRAHLETVTMRDSVPAGPPPSGRQSDVAVPAATLEALQAETERLEALVDDLFALSRAQAGAIEMHLEAVDAVALVEETAALMRPLARREGAIALSAEILHRPLWAMADPARLQQILANLVRNAVRHTPDGGIIIMSVKRQAGWVVVSVVDTGEGIPAEHLPHIFDRFYRADPARSRATGGAGLGLAIVREFVELMGGRVEVESALGEGTRFHVFLPATSHPGG